MRGGGAYNTIKVTIKYILQKEELKSIFCHDNMKCGEFEVTHTTIIKKKYYDNLYQESDTFPFIFIITTTII